MIVFFLLCFIKLDEVFILINCLIVFIIIDLFEFVLLFKIVKLLENWIFNFLIIVNCLIDKVCNINLLYFYNKLKIFDLILLFVFLFW